MDMAAFLTQFLEPVFISVEELNASEDDQDVLAEALGEGWLSVIASDTYGSVVGLTDEGRQFLASAASS